METRVRIIDFPTIYLPKKAEFGLGEAWLLFKSPA